MDVDARIEAIRADAGQRLTDTNVWTNLNAFTGHGGKILFYHGVSDPWFSAWDTLDYWHRAEQANGAIWADTSRFYMVPGMGHCSGGANTYDSFDLLGAVVDWVEQGKAPEAVTATHTLPISGPTPGERPLCPWPSYPAYIGGDEKSAASFQCRKGV
jgi:feruloyl esterase